jgi:hypothetical protein
LGFISTVPVPDLVIVQGALLDRHPLFDWRMLFDYCRNDSPQALGIKNFNFFFISLNFQYIVNKNIFLKSLFFAKYLKIIN